MRSSSKPHTLPPSLTPVALLTADGQVVGRPSLPMPSDEIFLALHRTMVLARRFDQQATALTKQGRLAVYPSARGQEASEIGAVMALRPQDWLTKVAMPVVRYRTRDLTRLLPGTARPMRRMERITGRSDDMIILRGVNLFPTNIEELILQTAALSPHFQCILSRPDRLDELTVRVERRADADPVTGDIAGAVLCDRIKNTIGVTVMSMWWPGAVERSTGKVQCVVDTRGA